MRVAVYLALAVGLFTTSVAGAAPKGHNCPMVTSASGGSAYTDVRSADISSGPKFVIGVLRVGSTTTSPTSDPKTLLAVKWRLAINLNSLTYLFAVTRRTDLLGKTTDTPEVSLAGEGLSSDKYEWKVGKDFIEWKVPRKEFKVLVTPGKVFQGLTASTTWNGGNADTASEVIRYVDRAKACIPTV